MSKSFVVALLLSVAVAPSAAAADGITAGEEFSLLANGPGDGIQATPAVAFGNGVYLVAWREGWHGKGGAARIYAARVSSAGELLDPRAIEIASAKAGVQERPRLAFGGGVFLVVWQDLRSGKDYDVLAMRIDADGKLLDREPLAVANQPHNQVLPDVASSGQDFIAVWQGFDDQSKTYRGYATPISATGKIGTAVETGISPQPKIAHNGASYLVAGGGAGVFSGTIRAVRLDSSAAPQGKPTEVMRGTKAAEFSISPLSGKAWIVASHRSPPDPWGWGGPGAIRAGFINSDGQMINEDAVKEPSGVNRRLPGWLDFASEKKEGATWPWGPSATAYDGKQPVVVWQRHHLTGEKMTNFTNCDLIAARMEGFKPRDLAGVPVAASPAEEKAPALASSGDGRLLLVYERHQDNGTVVISSRLVRTK